MHDSPPEPNHTIQYDCFTRLDEFHTTATILPARYCCGEAGRRWRIDDLATLGDLIRRREIIDNKIAEIIQRPALLGHVGEYIASIIFHIQLESSASHKGFDGHFIGGPLKGSTVNVKWYTKQDGLLDLLPGGPAAYYLVLTGPKRGALSSKGSTSPWIVSSVFLFNSRELLAALAGKKIGTATSVRQHLWRDAEIYPQQRNQQLPLSREQLGMLAHFAPLHPLLGGQKPVDELSTAGPRPTL